MNNYRGQIGETMTWVVATLVIIIILGISIFVVKFAGLNGKEFVLSSSEDLIMTKSVVSFFSYEKNFNDLETSIIDDDYSSIKQKIENFLRETSGGAGDFRVFVDDKLKDKSVVTNNFHGLSETKRAYFQFNIGDSEIGLSFRGGENE